MARTLLTLCLSVLGFSPLLAQGRPDFSGTWVMDEKRSGSPSQPNFVRPVEWAIEHSADSFVVIRKRGDDAATFKYALLAKAPGTVDPAVKSPTAEAPGNRGFWAESDQLILETNQTIQGKTVTTREVLTLAPTGELLVDRVVEVEHGYTMKGAQNFSAVKDTFVKR